MASRSETVKVELKVEKRIQSWWSAHPVVIGMLALILLTGIVYGPTVSHDFIWDDHEQIVNNEVLRSWSNLDRIWTEDVLSLSRDDGTRSNYYRPLFFLQYLGYYQVFGGEPMAWHFLALLWHLAATALVWWLLTRMGWSLASSWVAAALFCVHPAHGESVGWVAAAFNDPPAAVFILAALGFHLRFMKRGKVPWLAAASLGFGLALGLKESSLSFVLLVPLVDLASGDRAIWDRGRSLVVLGATVLPFLGLVVLSPGVFQVSPLTWAAVQLAFSIVMLFLFSRGRKSSLSREYWADGLYVGLSVLYLALRQATIGTVFGRFGGGRELVDTLATLPSLVLYYFKLLVWPWNLGPSYPIRFATGWSDPQAWVGVLLLVALGAVVWRLYSRYRWVGLSVLWILACLWPALNVRSFRETYLVHQRYLYLAVLGLCLGLVALLWDRLDSPRLRTVLFSSLLLLWSASTLYHHRFWASDVALWQRVVELDPANAAGWDWLGADALKAGRVEEAERKFSRSIEADPKSPLGYRNLALLRHWYQKRPQEALSLYQAALDRFDPSDRATEETIRRTELNLAVGMAQLGQVDEAVERIDNLIKRPPPIVEAFRNLAVIEQKRGHSLAAMEVLEAGLLVFPEDRALLSMHEDLSLHHPQTKNEDEK